MKYICQVCGYVYDEEAEGIPFAELPDGWKCPMCKAPKNMFAAEEDGVAEAEPSQETIETDLEKLSPGAMSALFSNLARGAEKQYREHEASLLRKIADYFASASPAVPEAGMPYIRALADEDISSLYPEAKRTASAHGDRGALRACTWGEKTGRMLQAVLESYEKEGESALAGTQIWVCSICGFIYIGDNPPALCPVCKVPDWKFEKIV